MADTLLDFLQDSEQWSGGESKSRGILKKKPEDKLNELIRQSDKEIADDVKRQQVAMQRQAAGLGPVGENKPAQQLAEYITSLPATKAAASAVARNTPVEQYDAILDAVHNAALKNKTISRAGLLRKTAAGAYTGAMNLTEAGLKLTGIGKMSDEQEKFARQLHSVWSSADSLRNPDASWADPREWIVSAAEMAPTLIAAGAAGAAVSAGSKAVGIGAKLTGLAREAGSAAAFIPELYTNTYDALLDRGVSPSTARWAAVTSSGLQGAIFARLPKALLPQLGGEKVVAKKLADGIVKHYAKTVAIYGPSTMAGVNAVDYAVQEFATGHSPKIKELIENSANTYLHSVGPMAILAAPGAISAKISSPEHLPKVIKEAESGKAPSRKQWEELGLPPEDGKSKEARLQGIQKIAAQIKAVAEPKIQPIAPTEIKPAELKAKLEIPDGGFTYQPIAKAEPSGGYGVSVFPGREKVIKASEITEKDISDYIEKNKDVFDESPENFLGGWHDPETGNVHLDISRVVSTVEEAAALGQKHNQKAIFDFQTFSSVPIEAEAPIDYILSLKEKGYTSQGIADTLNFKGSDYRSRPWSAKTVENVIRERKIIAPKVQLTKEEFQADFRKNSKPAIRFNDGTVVEGETRQTHAGVVTKAQEQGLNLDDVTDDGWTYQGKFISREELIGEKPGIIQRKLTSEAVQGKPGYGEFPEVLTPEAVVAAQPFKATEAKPAGKDFIQDEIGRIGIKTEAIGRGIGFVKHAMRRFLTSKGELPANVYDRNIAKRGDILRVQKEMSFIAKDYDRAVKETYGKRELTADEIAVIDSALKGELPLESLPEAMREPVGVMRNHIDVLSEALINCGAIEGKLEATVDKNLGSYVTRSYKAFDDPAWARKVPDEVRNKTKAFLRQEYPNKSEAEIHGLIESILYEGKAAETPIAILRGSKLGAKDLSILMQRKDVPPEIRALLGEYKDPRLNYARSVTKLGNLIANHLFLNDVKQMGMGTFFSEVPIEGPYGIMKTRIAADTSSPMNPLNGLYTTPEIKDAFQRAVIPSQSGAVIQFALRLNGAVKVSKTVYSVMSEIRNYVGNIGIATRNGYWHFGAMKQAWKATTTGLLNLSDEQWRNYYLRKVELGLVNQSTRAEELREYIKDIAQYGDTSEYMLDIEARRSSKFRKLIRKTTSLAAGTYQAGDDFWKIFGHENEIIRWGKAMPELSYGQLEEMTAKMVLDVHPSESRVPEGIKKTRKLPFIAPFITFNAEIIRSTYHTLKYAQMELRSPNPRVRIIGAERVVGTILSISGTGAIAAATRFLCGVSKDEDEDMRKFTPPWQKNSRFAYLGKTKDGNIRYVDLAYSDPHNTLVTPIKAFMRGEDIKNGLWDGLKDVAEPYINEDILFKAITESWRNHTATGGRVFNPEESVDQQAADVTAHIWAAFEPGTITSAKRIAKGFLGIKAKTGKAYNPTIETIATISGQRIAELDIRQSLSFKAREYIGSIRDSDVIFAEPLLSRSETTPKELTSAYNRSNEARKVIWKEAFDSAQAAIRLGVPRKDVIHILMSSGVSERDTRSIMAGVYIPPKITESRARAAIKANPQDGASRIQAILEAQRNAEK